MRFFCKIAPILMLVGFVSLAVGVFLSMSYYLQAAYTLVGIGLILYIAGRIGVHFTPKAIKKDSDTENE